MFALKNNYINTGSQFWLPYFLGSVNLNFKKFESNDINLLKPLLAKRNSYTCENTLANIAVWADEYNIEFAFTDTDVYIKLSERNGFIFSIPVYKDLAQAVEKIKEYCFSKDIPAKFWFEEGSTLEQFLDLYREEYLCFNSKSSSEYIYLRENLANLSGKKFHSKRNHISAFSKKYNWTFERLSKENINDAMFVADEWYAARAEQNDSSISTERAGIALLLQNIEFFKVQGGILRVDGKPVAFTCGTPITDSVFDVNFEKALPDYQGAYAVINREFAKSVDYEYLNREDDLGLPGLRKAKLSYHPNIILKKYICLPRTLYNQSFELHLNTFPEDDAEFTAQLFDTFFAESCFYKYLNGKIVSQLFVLNSVVNGLDAGYIYAAATDEKYRRQGFMKELIEKVKLYYNQLTLKPATNELYNYYAKFGFKELFYCSTVNIDADSSLAFQSQKIEDIETFKRIRNQLLTTPGQLLCDDALKLVINNYLVFTDCTAQPSFLAICRKESDRLVINELIVDGDFHKVIAGLAAYLECKTATAYMFNTNSTGKFGMLYNKTDNISTKLFMGIALD